MYNLKAKTILIILNSSKSDYFENKTEYLLLKTNKVFFSNKFYRIDVFVCFHELLCLCGQLWLNSMFFPRIFECLTNLISKYKDSVHQIRAWYEVLNQLYRAMFYEYVGNNINFIYYIFAHKIETFHLSCCFQSHNLNSFIFGAF